MRRFVFAGAIVAFAAAPFAAVAGPDYTYLGAGYGVIEPDGLDDFDGFTLEGSVAVHENVHLLAEFIQGEEGPIEIDRTRIAAGYNMPLNSTTDFVARAGWSFIDVDAGRFISASDDGFLAQVGVRSMATEVLELNAFLVYDDLESELGLQLGGVYNFTPNLGATAGYSYSGEIQTVGVGLRYNF
jgi:opacity protein-like surface antigen